VVSTAIVGARTIEELRSDLGALSVHIDAEVMARLDLARARVSTAGRPTPDEGGRTT
jgi:aryl-alcohol dehydrogenase-like predicted oxidoreductase